MKMILSSLILVFFACNSTKKSVNMQDFPSGEYDILELNAKDFKPQKTYTISIDAKEQRISGKFDCNNYSCKYEKDGQNIDFGFAVATKMYCEGQMHNENALFGKLNSIKNFEYNGEFLKFFDEKQTMILKLKKQES